MKATTTTTTTTELIPWNRSLPEKLTDPQLVKKFPIFYGTEGSLPHSKQPTTSPCPEPHRSSSCPHPTSLISVIKLSSHLHLGFLRGLLPSDFAIKTLYVPLLPPYVLHGLPISVFLILYYCCFYYYYYYYYYYYCYYYYKAMFALSPA